MFRSLRISCLVLSLTASSSLPAQTEFSADIVDLQKPGTPTLAKIYFSNEKRRIEMTAASGEDAVIVKLPRSAGSQTGTHMQVGGQDSVIIMDLATHISSILWRNQNVYAQAPLERLTPSELFAAYAFLQPKNVEDACPEWVKKAAPGSESCRMVVHDTTNGRKTVQYELSCYGEICRLWIDQKLGVLVKRESKWNSTELRNVREVPQAPDLFQIPIYYSRSAKLGGVISADEPQ